MPLTTLPMRRSLLDRDLLMLEFAWTTWEDSCKAYLLTDDSLRECRRPKRHNDEMGHASGFGDELMCWD